MIRIKKQLCALLSASILFGCAGFGGAVSASEYVYPDTKGTVDGIEVIDVGGLTVASWLTKYQGDGNTAIYTTHESYEGNGAMLVKNITDKPAFPANDGCNKTDSKNPDSDKIIPKQNYKVVFYQKPVNKNADGKYRLNYRMRYYNDFTVLFASIYDAETGSLIADPANAENKWYRTEVSFTAKDSSASTENKVGVAFVIETDSSTLLIDSVKMYHEDPETKEYVLMTDGTGVRNGGFEEGVAGVRGVDPTNVTAKAGVSSAVISWTNPQEQETRIYNGTELVGKAAAGATSAVITGLQNGTEYTFTVKGHMYNLESAGVSVKVTPHEGKYSDTVATIAGTEVFRSTVPNWNRSYMENKGEENYAVLYLTHEAYRGSAAMLVKSDTAYSRDICNSGFKKTGNDNAADNIIVGDTYKVEVYQKPLETNSDGKYTLCKGYRYYDNYDIVDMSVYDADTGAVVGTDDELESKWYRLEREFVATAKDAAGVNGAFAFWTTANFPAYLVDELKMYHKVDDSWVLMTDGTAVANCGFEKEVEVFYGMDPLDIKVENKTESAVISWTNPQEQKTRIYNGDILLAETEKGATSVTLNNLTGDVEYTFTVKGAGSEQESDGVAVMVYPFVRPAGTVDIIDGIVVFKAAPHWLPTYQGNVSAIYTTHEAYEGNASLLIVPSSEGTSYPANYELSKALDTNDNKDKVIEGDKYKIVYYQKPVSVGADGNYSISRRFRYYGEYPEKDSLIYDAQTNQAIAADAAIESKWYRAECEFTAINSNVNDWVGFAIQTTVGMSDLLLDNLQMYHFVDNEWVLMKDGTGVRNGNFEEGVTGDNTAPYDVENFKAEPGNKTASLTWDRVETSDLAGYAIYNDGTKIADIARNVTNYIVSGLENDKEYTFVIKAYDRSGNASEGTYVTVVPTMPVYETGEFVIGEKIVSGDNAVSIFVKNNKKADGLNAQLLLGLFDKATNTLVKAAASSVKTLGAGESDTLSASILAEDLNAADYELKAFLWESLDSVSPLKSGVSIGE